MQDQTRPPQSDAPPAPGSRPLSPESRPLSPESRQQRLREIAHRIWEAEGRPDGRAEANWRAAEAELAAEEAGPAPGIRARRALAKAKAKEAVARKTPARAMPPSGAEAPGITDTPARTPRGRTRRPPEDA